MRIHPASCPNCNSEQKFAIKLQETKRGWMEAFIKCAMCRWKKILYPTTTEIEVVRVQKMKLSHKAQAEIDSHGAMTGTTSMKLRAKRKEFAKLTEEMMTRVKEAHGGRYPYH